MSVHLIHILLHRKTNGLTPSEMREFYFHNIYGGMLHIKGCHPFYNIFQKNFVSLHIQLRIKMLSDKINLKEKLSMFTKHWSPRIIAEMNDYRFKIAKIKDEFIWHGHKDTDESL